MNLPNTILLEIFSYIPLPERWLVASVSRSWHQASHDPYLYRYVTFENLEYKTLVFSLQKLLSISSRVKTITIKGCYSTFIQNAVVPVHFSNRSNNMMLYSHITALQPPRRRIEYLKHNFQLHDQFSDVMNQLFLINKIEKLAVQNCTLDLQMTELFCTIAGHGHSLEFFSYDDNHDKGIHSSGLLKAIVIACPKMRHFRGLHSGMDDAVLATIARHWSSLESLTLCSLKSRDILGHAEIISDGHHLIGSSPTGRISGYSLWQILNRCQKLITLELFDLACISNRELSILEGLRDNSLMQQRQEKSTKRFAPYKIPSISIYATSANNNTNLSNNIPGSSIERLIINKYMTTPLSKPGFESLVRLFPKLHHLKYETNFNTFDNLFEGVTPDMFYAECAAVQRWCDAMKIDYIGQWDAPMTAEQRLMAGMASVSEGGIASL